MVRRRGSTKKDRIILESSLGDYLMGVPAAGVNPLLAHDVNYPKTPIAGIDEVGRGPLAGPLVAAAVILEPGRDYPGVMDSKKLTHFERMALSDIIKQHCLDWAISFKTPKEVDEMNPLQATLQAMTEACDGLKIKPGTILVDGTMRPPIDGAVVPIEKGDTKSLSIAAASIIAKVARDAHMLLEAKKYPHYGFDRNKGYGTKEHLLALSRFGPCEIHRRTYRSVRDDSPPKPGTPLGKLFF
ncbi:MAG: ribonuclease HII [Deltaproteobacteria bacterium]|jgi:ribonuclease HII|nr:ribonuclease HII [Deltaproteobacteria bacterium]